MSSVTTSATEQLKQYLQAKLDKELGIHKDVQIDVGGSDGASTLTMTWQPDQSPRMRNEANVVGNRLRAILDKGAVEFSREGVYENQRGTITIVGKPEVLLGKIQAHDGQLLAQATQVG